MIAMINTSTGDGDGRQGEGLADAVDHCALLSCTGVVPVRQRLPAIRPSRPRLGEPGEQALTAL